jgi:ABC-2 type transport system ATP-binding protein
MNNIDNFSIEASHLTKSYGRKKVLAIDDITLRVNAGEIFGLIGPDGAGKTTIIRILTTLILADKGTAAVNGQDVVKDYKKIRGSIGYMPGRFSLYQDMTVEENLNLFATVFNTTIEENYNVVKDIYSQIEPFKDRRAGKLSGGMKQKLALSCALIHKPSVLFLDEPTTGVDPVSRKEFWGILKGLKQQGITILVSTPYMDEANLCDRIALINKGKLLKIDSPENIILQFGKILWAVQGKNMPKLLVDLRLNNHINSSFAFGDSHHVTLKDEHYSINELETYLREKGHEEIFIRPIEPGIEDCFMDIGVENLTAGVHENN